MVRVGVRVEVRVRVRVEVRVKVRVLPISSMRPRIVSDI